MPYYYYCLHCGYCFAWKKKPSGCVKCGSREIQRGDTNVKFNRFEELSYQKMMELYGSTAHARFPDLFSDDKE